jgi:signal transduction histidine kinase
VNDVAMATAVLDPAALLDRALARVCETVEAEGGGAYVREGDALVLVASRGIPHGAVAPLRRLLPGEGAAGRAVERLEPVVIRDAAALGQRWHAVSAAGITQLLGVPLVAQSRAVGALVVGRRAGRDFTPDEVRLVAAIGAQVGLAVDNARLYGEARRRAEELGLVLEVGRSLVSTLHLDEVLDAGIRNVARIVEAPQAYLLLADRAGQTLEFRAAWGEDHSVVGERIPIGDGEGSLAAWAFVHRTPVAVDDARDPRLNADLVRRAGSRSHLALPLVVRDRAIGVAFIIETRRERTFVPAEVERAAAIANQLAIAVENARLYDDLSRSYAELAHAQRQLIQQERLAALGELAAVVAHEVRNPLGVIFNSLGSLRRLVRPTGDAEMLLDIVDEEADRLNRIVGDLLDFARPATPLLQLEPIERVVDDAVAAALARAAPGVKLAREVEAGLPPVPMDARLVHQAVLNVALNAVQAMPEGGRLRVRLARERDAVLVEVEDEGPGIPEEVRERVFEPFFTTKASGTGLGLAVVKRILDGHGGEVVARNREGAGAVFTLRFPLSPTPAGPPDEPVASRAPVG